MEEQEKELNYRLGTMILSDEPDNTEESEDLEVFHLNWFRKLKRKVYLDNALFLAKFRNTNAFTWDTM